MRSGGAHHSDAGPPDPLPWHVDVHEGVFVGDMLGVTPPVCRGRWADLSPRTAHALARIRIDVLVVEAANAHADLDDLDLDPCTEHLWIADGEVAVAYLRMVHGPDRSTRIDRTCDRPDVRGLGLIGALITDVVARHGADRVRALADPDTVPFYLQHGFEAAGPSVRTPGGRRLPMTRHPEAPWR